MIIAFWEGEGGGGGSKSMRSDDDRVEKALAGLFGRHPPTHAHANLILPFFTPPAPPTFLPSFLGLVTN